MPSMNVPVLIWRDYQDGFTASPVAGHLTSEGVAAFDDSRRAVLRQVEAHLSRVAKDEGGRAIGDFNEPVLFFVNVTVRPAYPGELRNLPCAAKITLRVPSVRGRRASGLACCSLPTLGIAFHYSDDAKVEDLVVENVRHLLDGRTVAEVSRFLPPRDVVLDSVQAKVTSPKRGTDRWEPDIGTLKLVAQPAGSAAFRKPFSAAFERESELRQLVSEIRSHAGSLLLLGPEGSGKTTLLVAAVRSVETRDDDQPGDEPMGTGTRYRFWHTSASRIVAGMQYLGQWQERCEQIIRELSSIGGVLCFDSLADLVRVGGTEPSSSVGAFLVPFIQNGELRLICESTPAELDAVRRVIPALASVLEVVRIDVLSTRSARTAVARVANNVARDAHLDVDPQVVDLAVRLFKRFMPYHPLPGSAVGFLRRVFDQSSRDGVTRISPDCVMSRFTEESGMPDWLLDDETPLRVDDVCTSFQSRIVGQDAACRRIARLVCTFKAGLNDPQRPVASLLFCGPTGVGKTQLAKNLSSYLFGHGNETDRMVRLDMSEYALPHQADRLITKADGSPSKFIERVRNQPFVVVLLDEIEKAADNVFDVLLGLLDEGRLTDRFGRVTWFRSAIVIMTSNLGASASKSVGFTGDHSDVYEREVRSFFRPEFFNRLDATITFRALDRKACAAITRLELDEVVAREGLARRRLKLLFTDQLVHWIMDQGFDPRFGARPLQRVIQHRVVAPISRFLVENPQLRDAVVHVDYDLQRKIPLLQVDGHGSP